MPLAGSMRHVKPARIGKMCKRTSGGDRPGVLLLVNTSAGVLERCFKSDVEVKQAVTRLHARFGVRQTHG